MSTDGVEMHGGELVIWNGTRLDLDLLQRRLVNPGNRAVALAARHPASFMIVDLVALDGKDLRFQRRRCPGSRGT